MSSFLVGDDHITMLVTAAVNMAKYGFSYYHDGNTTKVSAHDRAALTTLGRVLRAENVQGQLDRYGDDDGNPVYRYPASQYGRPGRATPVDALKGAACYRYQACESSGWDKSEANTIIQAMESVFINALPGYDASPAWDWEGPA